VNPVKFDNNSYFRFILLLYTAFKRDHYTAWIVRRRRIDSTPAATMNWTERPSSSRRVSDMLLPRHTWLFQIMEIL